MKRYLLILLFLLSPLSVKANSEESCMDANFSRISTVDYKSSEKSLTIYLQVARPKEVFMKTTRGVSLNIELQNTYILREKLFVGCHLELRDLGGSTLLIVKGGKRLISYRSNDSYLILTVSI